MPWIRSVSAAPLQITEGNFTFGVQKLTLCDQCSASGYVIIVESDSSNLGRALEILQKLGIDVGPLDPPRSETEARQHVGPNDHTVHVFRSGRAGLVGPGSCHEDQRRPTLGLIPDRDLKSRDQLIGTVEPGTGVRVVGIVEDDRAHETSPSVDGTSTATVGDGPVAEAQEEASATAGTDTPADVDTSPLVVHKTASLQNAISARDAVFFRIRNLTAQPISEFSYEQLAKLGEELGIKQFQVYRCTLDLEKVRAAEVSRGEAGMFSNRRRPGARFSHPAPPAAPETPDAAQ